MLVKNAYNILKKISKSGEASCAYNTFTASGTAVTSPLTATGFYCFTNNCNAGILNASPSFNKELNKWKSVGIFLWAFFH
jgi:hypothetical protein